MGHGSPLCFKSCFIILINYLMKDKLTNRGTHNEWKEGWDQLLFIPWLNNNNEVTLRLYINNGLLSFIVSISLEITFREQKCEIKVAINKYGRRIKIRWGRTIWKTNKPRSERTPTFCQQDCIVLLHTLYVRKHVPLLLLYWCSFSSGGEITRAILINSTWKYAGFQNTKAKESGA